MPYVYGSNPSIKHNVGQLFGHALNVLPGHSTLGSNITNPNVNYHGVANAHPAGTIAPESPTSGLANFVQGAPAVLSDSTENTTTAPGDSFSSAQHTLLNALPGQLGHIRTSAAEAAGNYGRSVKSAIQDLIDQLNGGQTNIDTQAVQNELARKQGTEGVLSMLGRGIQSGGVILANRNAGSSSGTEAIARAYSILGRQQQTGVNNQYAQGQNAIDQAQNEFNLQGAASVRHLRDDKLNAVNSIVQSAQGQLAQLDNDLINASLPDRVNIEQEKQRIRENTMNALAEYDAQISQATAGVRPASTTTNRLKAQQLATAGTAPESPFSFTSQAPAQLQGTGPLPSSLPLFLFPSSRKQRV